MKRRLEEAAERAQSPLAAALDDAALAPAPAAKINNTPFRAKRSCGGGGPGAFLPPGALPPPTAAAWAEHLLGAPLAAVAAHVAASPLLAPALPGLPRVLQAAAELNAALQPNLHTLPRESLRGYASLTRCDRAALWREFEGSASPSPSLLLAADAHARLLVRLLLVDAAPVALGGAAARPDACITRFTVDLPACMASWCSRWGLGAAREVSVLLLTAHARAEGGASPSPSSSAPAWRVAVPLLPCA